MSWTGGRWDHGGMVQQSSRKPLPGERPTAVPQDLQRLPLHNPATQQMLIVGKRREAAEAKLEQRLRAKNTPVTPDG